MPATARVRSRSSSSRWQTIRVSYGTVGGAATPGVDVSDTVRRPRSTSVTFARITRTLSSRANIARSGYVISPGDSAPVDTWYVSGWNRWKLRLSISVISTGRRRSRWTARRPPNPPPTTTTRLRRRRWRRRRRQITLRVHDADPCAGMAPECEVSTPCAQDPCAPGDFRWRLRSGPAQSGAVRR